MSSKRWLFGGLVMSGLYAVSSVVLLARLAQALRSGGNADLLYSVPLSVLNLPGTILVFPLQAVKGHFAPLALSPLVVILLFSFPPVFGSSLAYFAIGALVVGGRPRSWSLDRLALSTGVIAILLLSGCIIAAESATTNTSDTCSTYTGAVARQSCFHHAALGSRDPALCTDDACLSDVAEQRRDSSICGKIQDKRDYFDSCVAYAIGDVSYCATLAPYYDKGQCYFGMAVRTSNILLCLKIADTSERKECQARISK